MWGYIVEKARVKGLLWRRGGWRGQGGRGWDEEGRSCDSRGEGVVMRRGGVVTAAVKGLR